MHEMALTQSVVDLVRERTEGRRVTRVHLRVGRLSGVVAESMSFCYDLVTVGTSLEGSVLEIEQPSGRIRCHDCGSESEVPDLVRLCRCGIADVEILAGEELMVTSVEAVREVACV
jgi:hydrogenase nickel incorporation protein HypA/HybF